MNATEQNIWVNLLAKLELSGEIVPVSDRDLDRYESEKGFSLPASFRDFAKVFGPGRLTAIASVLFAAPGKQEWEWTFDMYQLNDFIAETPDVEVEEYCLDPAFYRNAICFASWGDGWFVWDRRACLAQTHDELPIYLINRPYEIIRVADSFTAFIFDRCLKEGLPGYLPIEDEPFEFRAGTHVI